MKRDEKVRRSGFTKNDHIKYWVDAANKDWIAIKKMLECGSYVHALFFMHLVLEKLLKAHWVKCNPGNYPPRIHDLRKLAGQIHLEVDNSDILLLIDMNVFQLEGRYPDHLRNLFKIYKKRKTYIIFASVNSLRKCLLKGLQ